ERRCGAGDHLGILLPNFYIQPAQAQGEAQGEVQAQAQGEVQAELQAKAQPKLNLLQLLKDGGAMRVSLAETVRIWASYRDATRNHTARVGGTSPFGWKKILASDLFHF
ncbi:hypothetical protein Ocin01_14742, partial [Orchesella cincta]